MNKNNKQLKCKAKHKYGSVTILLTCITVVAAWSVEVWLKK